MGGVTYNFSNLIKRWSFYLEKHTTKFYIQHQRESRNIPQSLFELHLLILSYADLKKIPIFTVMTSFLSLGHTYNYLLSLHLDALPQYNIPQTELNPFFSKTAPPVFPILYQWHHQLPKSEFWMSSDLSILLKVEIILITEYCALNEIYSNIWDNCLAR